MKKYLHFLLCLLLVMVAITAQGCTTATIPGEDTADSLETTPALQDLHIVLDGASAYSIVIREEAEDGVVEASRSIMNAIQSVTDVKLNWTDDYVDSGKSAPAKEILIGLTNREESLEVLQDVRYGEFVIRPVGEKLVIAAWDEESLKKACSQFTNYIKRNGQSGSFVIPGDYSDQAVGLEPLLQMPHYGARDELVEFIDLADVCYMLYANDTNLTEFEAYYKVLENAGYTRLAYNKMAENHYVSYVNDEMIIHASYLASGKDARVTIEKKYDTDIFVESPYEKVCEPTVTLVGLEGYGGIEGTVPGTFYGNPIGLLMIFRMEDGRFIVVDGGGMADETVSLIYDNLYELAVDKDNIVIAAWMLTHAHGDHVGGFTMFTNSARRKQVTVQNIFHHFSTNEQYKNCKDAGRAAETRPLLRAYKDANIIKAHAGQVLKVGGAEIEILCTSGELEPYTLQDHNTTSVVFRVTAKDNSVMVLGDASYVTCSFLVKHYGDYLKSDMVQLSHHGYAGGTIALYDKVRADVVLWPGGVGGFDGGLEPQDLRYRETNAHAISLADEVYVAGEAVHTLTMPYTPEETEKPKIIK
jgi:glyoxylase-like metal-dependent hydrolase (beta-lactamase superfamily II)